MQLAVFWPRIDVPGLPAELHAFVYQYMKPQIAYSTSESVCVYPQQYILVGHKKHVTALCFGQTQDELFSASRDMTIRVWSKFQCNKVILLDNFVWNLQWSYQNAQLAFFDKEIEQKAVHFLTPDVKCDQNNLNSIVTYYQLNVQHFLCKHVAVYKKIMVVVGLYRVFIHSLDDLTYKRRIIINRTYEIMMCLIDENFIYLLGNSHSVISIIYVYDYRGLLVRTIPLHGNVMRIAFGPDRNTLIGFAIPQGNALLESYYTIDVTSGTFALQK